MMDDVSYQAAYHNVLKLFKREHYSKKKRAFHGGVVRASDWLSKGWWLEPQQCRFFAGKHVDVHYVHDGRCVLPGSLPQLAKIIYEGIFFF